MLVALRHSLLTSAIAVCTLVAAISPPAVKETLVALIAPAPVETSTSTHEVPLDSTKSGGASVAGGALPLVIVPPLLTTR